MIEETLPTHSKCQKLDGIPNFLQIGGRESHKMIFQIEVQQVVYINYKQPTKTGRAKDMLCTFTPRAYLDLAWSQTCGWTWTILAAALGAMISKLRLGQC